LCLTIVEILLTLLIVHIPLFLRIIYDAVGKPGMTWAGAVDLFWSGYKYGDILGYTAGMLASSTVWFFLNLRLFSSRPGRLLALTIGPLLLLFFASPVYFRDINGDIGNATFTVTYIQIILALSLLLWLVSIYQQRAIGNDIDLSGDKAVTAIKNKLSAGR